MTRRFGAAAVLFLVALSSRAVAGEEDYPAQLARALGVKDERWRQNPFLPWEARYARAKRLLAKGDFAAVDAILDELPPTSKWKAPEDWFGPKLIRWLAADEAVIQAWVKARPKSPYAHLALAKIHVRVAWQARGHGFAHTVKKEGWKVWSERIPQAKQEVDLALKLRPTLHLAHFQRLHVDRCIGTPREEFEQHFKEAKRHAPGGYPIYKEAFWFNLPRYYGTWEQAWAVVQGLLDEHPSHPTTLQIFAEACLLLARESTSGEEAFAKFFNKPQISGQIRELMAAVRKHRPDSRTPARLELKLARVYPLTQDRISELRFELANKHSTSNQVMTVQRTLSLETVEPYELQQANLRLLWCFLRGNEDAKEILKKKLVGPNPRKPLHPQGAHAIYRVLGGQGGYAIWPDEQLKRAYVIDHVRYGYGVEKDEAAAAAEHLEQAKAGNPHCAYRYASIRWRGLCGTTRDYQEGKKWALRAAELGSPDAILNVAEGKLRGNRFLIEKNLQEAEVWIKRCEDLGLRGAPALRKELEAEKARE